MVSFVRSQYHQGVESPERWSEGSEKAVVKKSLENSV